jgi:hypothetical protein
MFKSVQDAAVLEGVVRLRRQSPALWASLALVLTVALSLIVGLAAGAVPKSWGWAHNWWLLLGVSAGLLFAAVPVAVLQMRASSEDRTEHQNLSHAGNNDSSSISATSTSASMVAASPSATLESPSGHQRRQSPREPGSSNFSNLVYSLSRAISNQATIYQIAERAGINRGDLEDGFVNATSRWHTVLSLAVDSGAEEQLCSEAIKASPNRALHAAVAEYLGHGGSSAT